VVVGRVIGARRDVRRLRRTWAGTFAAMRSLGFHNNEVGGAARVDRFRQFIRFTARAPTGPDRLRDRA
jgi:hypothetical protein